MTSGKCQATTCGETNVVAKLGSCPISLNTLGDHPRGSLKIFYCGMTYYVTRNTNKVVRIVDKLFTGNSSALKISYRFMTRCITRNTNKVVRIVDKLFPGNSSVTCTKGREEEMVEEILVHRAFEGSTCG
ncbi:hypothetical protein KPH14_004908 [Odynerus spinipes]|uniref:Uncharacterized protein n=1 Tax=Odynerus spinipes TaxID=1348599 RepID=A0AAD9RN92_9HYME|nr:hypothetical protein KPH14_004908 [Odynerus spinipes]